jgi:hypothetical protein|tara:strand:+ start:1021 stop:1401 length:381 start_codon:yes stop_codon:yes gene_type:complete
MPDAHLTIEVGEYNGTPGFSIDQMIIEPNQLTPGIHTVDFEYDYGSTVKFKMFGKHKHDTRVDKNNKIIQDKFIEIKTLRLDYMQIQNWQFHQHIWNPYFAFDSQQQTLIIPSKEQLPLWYINLLG